ncbi:hypothetical protein AHAS_Ahas17G0099100 [Arachis hypogaea]
MENGERLLQLDGNNSHALLRWARNGSALLHSRSNDVAQLSSSASYNSSQFDENTKLKFAIVCFGNFAQFLAKTIVSQALLLILTYVVCDKVRIGNEESRVLRCYRFLDIFASEGCRMVEMSCAEHDWHVAGSQFVIHTTGRILEKLELGTTPINTKGYETLLTLVENTMGDSFDLYYGLFLYNLNAMEQLERFHLAFESLKKQLFNQLHSIYRKQLLEDEEQILALPERFILPEKYEDSDASSPLSKTVDTKGIYAEDFHPIG